MTSILVADDAPSVRKLLRLILEPKHQVVEAGDGVEAVQQLLEHRPQVAILDVAMPRATGIDVCREIRRDPRLAETVVIVITANGTPTDRSTALAAGANYFLPKPFRPTVILQLVDAIANGEPITVP